MSDRTFSFTLNIDWLFVMSVNTLNKIQIKWNGRDSKINLNNDGDKMPTIEKKSIAHTI